MENFENDLHYAMSNARSSNSDLLSDCLYTYADNTQNHLTMKLVSAITNHKKKSNDEDTNIPILTFKNSGKIIPLYDWENVEYYTTFFHFFSFLVLEAIYLQHVTLKNELFR